MPHCFLHHDPRAGVPPRHGPGRGERRNGVESVRQEEQRGGRAALFRCGRLARLGGWRGRRRRRRGIRPAVDPVGAEAPARAGETDSGPEGAEDGGGGCLLVEVGLPPGEVLGGDVLAVAAQDGDLGVGARGGGGGVVGEGTAVLERSAQKRGFQHGEQEREVLALHDGVEELRKRHVGCDRRVGRRGQQGADVGAGEDDGVAGGGEA